VIVMVYVDRATPETLAEFAEPARVQIGLRVAHGPRAGCPRRWLLNLAGWVYYTDDPDESWD
jgi:hypothetical protein